MNIKDLKFSLTFGKIFNGAVIAALAILFFVPAAKGKLIEGLMKAGLFQPHIPAVRSTVVKIEVPDITFERSNGQLVHLAALKGKVVFINFWATWCPPCIAELPSINALYLKSQADSNLVFLTVDADNDFSKSVRFMQRHHLSVPLVKANTAVPENMLGGSIPTTVIIDKSGAMVFSHEGAADYSNPQVVAFLKKLSRDN